MGSEPNFFNTPGADDARVPALPRRRRRASALAVPDRVEDVAPQPQAHRSRRTELRDRRRRGDRRRDRGRGRRLHQPRDPAPAREPPTDRARIYLVDPAPVVLAPFSDHAHDVRTEASSRNAGVTARARAAKVDEIAARSGDAVRRARDPHPNGGVGRRHPSIPELTANAGLPQGARRADRRRRPTSTVTAFPGVYALGDVANTLGPRRQAVPAARLGRAASRTVRGGQHRRRRRRQAPHEPFRYRDKGIMAMIGRNAAIAEVGPEAARAARRRSRSRRGSACTPGCSAAFRERVNALAVMGRGTTSPTRDRPRSSIVRTPPRSTGTDCDDGDRRSVEERRFRGEPAIELTAGSVSRGLRPAARHDRRVAAVPRRRTPRAPGRARRAPSRPHTGLPLLAPWANRLRGRRYRAAGVDVDLTDLAPRRRRQRTADPRTSRRACRLVGRRSRPARDTARLRASISVDAPAFPFPAPDRDHGRRFGKPQLDIDTTIVPTRSTRPVPVAFGWHPYLRLPARRAGAWQLRLPGATHRALDDRGIPHGAATREPAEAAAIGRRTFDDLYALGRDRRLAFEPEPGTRVELHCAPELSVSRRCGSRPGSRCRGARAHGRTDQRIGDRRRAARARKASRFTATFTLTLDRPN